MTYEDLRKELATSMKEKNRIRKQVVSDIMNIAKNIAIEKRCKENITEDIVDSAALKVMKTAKEQIETCPATRVELLQEYKEYFAYTSEFTPKMMSEEEIRKEVHAVMQEEVSDKINKGIVMKKLMQKIKGKADGRMVSKVVDEVLS